MRRGRTPGRVALGGALIVIAAIVVACGPPPPPSGPLTPAVEVATGNGHSCALRDTGTVHCWGRADMGQLGRHASANAHPTSVRVGGVAGATSLVTTALTTCAVLEDETARCWGGNDYGELGAGIDEDRSHLSRTVQGLSGVDALSGGGNHVCALLGGGTAACWGSNGWGQLGDDNRPFDSNVPVAVEGLTDISAISAGWDHTCALREDGTVWCWGENIEGQLGDGSTTLSTTPVQVVGIDDAVALDAGDRTTCAVLDGGAVRCWGSGRNGELGNGVMAVNYFSAVPVDVVDLPSVTQLTVGFAHVCGLVVDGTARCWGNGQQGRLGDGTSGVNSAVPVVVVGLEGATQLDANSLGAHTCARLDHGGVRCWGYNFHGQIGDGTSGSANSRSVPVPVLRFS